MVHQTVDAERGQSGIQPGGLVRYGIHLPNTSTAGTQHHSCALSGQDRADGMSRQCWCGRE